MADDDNEIFSNSSGSKVVVEDVQPGDEGSGLEEGSEDEGTEASVLSMGDEDLNLKDLSRQFSKRSFSIFLS